jgi:hypothetical protein
MTGSRYRLLDTAGGEIGIGEAVTLPGGSSGTVVDVYDDEYGQEGGVAATLAVEE